MTKTDVKNGSKNYSSIEVQKGRVLGVFWDATEGYLFEHELFAARNVNMSVILIPDE
jgi:hypothetical protein